MHTVIRKLYEIFLTNPHVSTDSRRIEAGSIFFALHGENFDGNRYAAAALEAGAIVAVVDDPKVIPSVKSDNEHHPVHTHGDDCDGSHHAGHAPLHEEDCDCADCTDSDDSHTRDKRYILVPDTLKALQALAAYHRHDLGLPILTITGSNGKTTTKELIGRVLSQKYHTTVTQGNLNNHIGVPLTLLSMTAETDLGIVEMGANHQQEIELLCSIAQPDFGLITNIGRAHLEGFGGPEGVRKGKGELFDYLASHGGTAFYLDDSEVLREMAAERPALNSIPYSASVLKESGDGQFAGALWEGRKIHTQLIGSYNLNNMAAAIAVGTYFGIEPDAIVTAIESYAPDNNRSQKQVTPHNTLILDAYNANPSSMQAALENFASAASAQPKAVILGDMRELGEYSASEHARIIELLHQLGITEAYLVGDHFTHADADSPQNPQNPQDSKNLKSPKDSKNPQSPQNPKNSQDSKDSKGYQSFADADALHAFLTAHPLRDHLILIKGSRGIQLEKVVELL